MRFLYTNNERIPKRSHWKLISSILISLFLISRTGRWPNNTNNFIENCLSRRDISEWTHSNELWNEMLNFFAVQRAVYEMMKCSRCCCRHCCRCRRAIQCRRIICFSVSNCNFLAYHLLLLILLLLIKWVHRNMLAVCYVA